MSALTLSAKLDRTDSNTTWGFRLHGGKDFGCQLTIQRVTPGSLANKCGLQVGDAIAKIGDTPTDGLRHKDAQSLIMRAGNSLELSLVRSFDRGLGVVRPFATSRGAGRPAPPQQQQYAPPPAAPYQPPPAAAAPYSPAGQQNYNLAARPFAGGAPGGTVPVAMNKQYNTPLGMYSVDNVMDSLSGQTRAMGVSGSDDASSTTRTPAVGTSMLHDHNHNPTPTSTLAGDGFRPISTNTNTSPKSVPSPPWKVEAERRSTSPLSTPSRMVDPHRAATPPWKVTPERRGSPTPPPPSHSAQYEQNVTPPWKMSGSPQRSASPKYTDKNYHGEDEAKWGYTSPHVQSKTFKILQSQLDSGIEPEVTRTSPGRNQAIHSTSPASHSPASRTVVNKQFNSPIGMYDKSALKEAYHSKSPSDSRSSPDPAGPRLYTPSDTYMLVHQEDSVHDVATDPGAYRPVAVKSFTPNAGSVSYTATSTNRLQRVGGGGAPAPAPAAAPSRPYNPPAPAPARPAPAHAPAPAAGGGTWRPSVPTGPRKMKLGRVGDAKSMATSSSGKIPICTMCGIAIRGPFVLALEKEWCPDHFICSNPNCKAPLIDRGFVEEEGQVFCEEDFKRYFAPTCHKCNNPIVGECVNALRNTYHPECFLCCQCRQSIGSGSFHMEDGNAYCEKDWQAMFQTKCYGCQFPIEPGDRWVEALSQNWHSECFNCSTCQVNLEGQAFYAKSGKPYCKKHAMAGGGRF